MRQIGTIPQESDARTFAAWLLTKGIKATVELEDGKWDIWVRDEDQLEQANIELAKFNENPADAAYQGAEAKAETIQREEIERVRKSRDNVVEMRGNWKSANGKRHRPLTLVLIGFCFAIAVIGGTFTSTPDSKEVTLADRALRFRDPMLLEAVNNPGANERVVRIGTFDSIKRGEIWRLVTPIFLHGDVIHLLFNLIMLHFFGSMIEDTLGTWKLALMVVLFAIASNLLQAALVGPNMIGISGVVYGLFGFVWLKSIFEPTPGIQVTQVTVVILIVWMALGFSGAMDGEGYGIANWAHAGGLACGMLFAWLPFWLRQQSKNKNR